MPRPKIKRTKKERLEMMRDEFNSKYLSKARLQARLSIETHQELMQIKEENPGKTMDEIINMLLDKWEEDHG